MQYISDTDSVIFDYDRPTLMTATNGFGGVATFTYGPAETTQLRYHWLVPAVASETHTFGAGLSNVTTTYVHTGDTGGTSSPSFLMYPNPYLPTTSDDFWAQFRGFGQVHEIDAAGNRIVHKYHPSWTWLVEPTGQKEFWSEVRDAGGVTWSKTETTWSVRSVANQLPSVGYAVNFVAPSTVTNTLRDGTVTKVNYTYDGDTPNCPSQCFGLLTKVDDFGEFIDVAPADGNEDAASQGDRTVTKSAYHLTGTSAWVFPVKYQEKLAADNGNALLSCAKMYYDGANSAMTAPTIGLLTANSVAIEGTTTQCEGGTAFTRSTNTYSIYETYNGGTQTYGNVAQTSAATSTAPESQSPGGPIGPIQVFVRAARVGPDGNNNIKVFIRSGGVDAESSVKTLSSSWGYVSETWTNDPATGGAWTPAAVNALEAGVRNAMGPSGGGGVAVTQVYVVTGGGQTLRPIGNGSYLEWGELFGSGTTHWDRVAEVTPDDLGSYIMDNSWNGTERDTFQLSHGNYAFNGWIPTGVPYTQTVYDTSHHIFPISQTNVLGQTTTISYDYVLGKPTLVTEPTGHTATTVYDALGRVLRSFDNLDSDAWPTVRYTYSWGAIPNSTLTETKASAVPSATYTSSVSCMDGFGREFQHTQTYGDGLFSYVRTDYDNRGLKSVVTNPASTTGLTCPSSPTAVSGLDRTASTYDPLGDAITTMSIAAGNTTGPYSQTNYNGKTTTQTDARFNVTTSVKNLAARTLTVSEPANPTTILRRPTGQGYYSQWTSATPNQAHYLNVDEIAPDDDTSQYNNNSGQLLKDTQTFPGAGASGTVAAVIFHFRWKHSNASVPNPNGPDISPIFRQNGSISRGPSFHSDNASGWRNDSWIMTTNPRPGTTGTPWTLADVNGGLEFGFEMSTTTGAWPYVSQAWVEVVTQSTSSNNTVYQYDPLGHLTNVTDPASNLTTISYDLAGRKTGMDDRDMGVWTYSYDAAGGLMYQTDARNVLTTLTYDSAERLTGKTYSNGDPPVSFLYDSFPDSALCPQGNTAIGRMTRMTDGAGQQFACFDVRGRAVTSRRVVDGVNYESSTTYDALNQPMQMVYPDGDVVTYSATQQGAITGVSSDVDGPLPLGPIPSQTLLINATTTPWGAVATLPLGSGQTTTYSYDYRARLTNIQTATVQNVTLTYDDASNVASVADSTETAAYSYDQLNRLTGAAGFSGGLSAAYSYNAIGNLLTKQEGSSSLSLAYPASGPASVRPHAVTSTTGSQALSLAYDPNGNLATQGASTYSFDAENRLHVRDTASGAFEYTYDGNGTMLKRATVGSAQTVTLRPNSQGFYSQWTATPNVAHYQNVDDTTADDDATYLEQSLGTKLDSHLYPAANVPAGTVIDKVTLKYRWKAIGSNAGVVIPFYRQAGANGFATGTVHVPADGWVVDARDFLYNPVSGRYWTAAEVNAGMEFGVRTFFANWTPRVTQVWVDVTYRVPTDSTVYIGGAYEKKSDGSVTKYYGAFGKMIAIRQVPSGGGQGTLYYPLQDHLGSTVDVVDTNGVPVPNARTTYWPYGATRSGGVSQTDKLYTGQQVEPGDSALGLYNYKARFYSTVLGRFASPDSMSNDGLNRYTYVRNNPLRWIDPSGYCVPGVDDYGPCAEDSDVHPLVVIRFLLDAGLDLYEIQNLAACGWVRCGWVPPSTLNGEYRLAPVIACGDPGVRCFEPLQILVDIGLDFIPGIGDVRALIGCNGDAMCSAAVVGAFALPVPGDSRAVGALLRAARKRGLEAEARAGIIKNTKYITVGGRRRLPDELLDDKKILTEVKDANYVYYSSQLRDYARYSKENGYTFQLVVKEDAKLSEPLLEAIANKEIALCRVRCRRRRRGGITAGEFLDQLEEDEDYQRYQRDQERWRERLSEEYRKDAAGLLAELNELGYPVDSVDWLYNTPYDYRSAVPALIRWLPQLQRAKLSVVRALSVPWARPDAARPLIEEFKRAPEVSSGDMKWTIGNALSVVADDSVYQEIADLVTDPRHGRARDMLPLSFLHMKKNRRPAIDIALKLLDDDDVVVSAIRFLKRVNAVEARERVGRLLEHPDANVRREATLATAKFDKMIGKAKTA